MPCYEEASFIQGMNGIHVVAGIAYNNRQQLAKKDFWMYILLQMRQIINIPLSAECV